MVTAIRTSYSIGSLLIGVCSVNEGFLSQKKTGTEFSVAGFTTRSLKSRGDHVGISVHRVNFNAQSALIWHRWKEHGLCHLLGLEQGWICWVILG